MTITERPWDWADVAALGVIARIMVPRAAKHPVRFVLEAYEWKLAGVRQTVAVIASVRRDDYVAGWVAHLSVARAEAHASAAASASAQAIDAIAKLANDALGTPEAGWEYSGQVVRDIELLVKELRDLRERVARAEGTNHVLGELREVVAMLTGEQATREKVNALMAEVSSRPTMKLLPDPTTLAWLAVAVDASIISSSKAREICGIGVEQWREQEPEFKDAMRTLHDAAMEEAEAVMLGKENDDDDES
jgi:hypothetical protein